MIKNLLLPFLLCACSLLNDSKLFAQQPQLPSAKHTVIVETRNFTLAEVQLIQEKLSVEGPLHIQEKCPAQGLLVVAVPVTASFRINTIEEIAISAVTSALNYSATIDRNRTTQNVANCSNQ